MARQYAKTAAVRRSILEACLAAFGESGFHGASMAEIARRAGISHTGLLHHFPRKEDLLTAVLDLHDERTRTYLQEHGDLTDAGDPAAILRGMIAALVEHRTEVGLSELAATLSAEATTPSHPAHHHFAERYRNIRHFLARLFRRLQQDDRLSTSLTPEELAATTIALTDGLRVQWLYARDGGPTVDGLVARVLALSVPELRDAGGAGARG